MKNTTTIIKKMLEEKGFPGCKRISKKKINNCTIREFKFKDSIITVNSGENDDEFKFDVNFSTLSKLTIISQNNNPVAYYYINEDEDDYYINVVPIDYWNLNKSMLDHYPNKYQYIANSLDLYFDGICEWEWITDKNLDQIVYELKYLNIITNQEFSKFMSKF